MYFFITDDLRYENSVEFQFLITLCLYIVQFRVFLIKLPFLFLLFLFFFVFITCIFLTFFIFISCLETLTLSYEFLGKKHACKRSPLIQFIFEHEDMLFVCRDNPQFLSFNINGIFHLVVVLSIPTLGFQFLDVRSTCPSESGQVLAHFIC